MVLGSDMTSVESSDHCVVWAQDSITREFEVTVKQVVRSLSTWMQTLIPTSKGKPTRRKGSVRLKTNASECLELRALPAALIGVDFGPATDSPKNWKNFDGSTNGTVTNLTDESGVASKISLDIDYEDGEAGVVNAAFAASQLPKHSQSLAGLNGAIRDDSKITLTYNNLIPSGLYEVYVFGGSTQADTQYITLAGHGQSQKFSQILDPGKLVVNGLAGSSGKDLSAYAKTVTATASGKITISAEGVELPECSLAGIAIRPVLSDIQLNSVKSDGESTLTVKYTIKDAAAKPFRITAYESGDTLFTAAKDKLAGFLQISDPADLTPGLHTKNYQIGQQIKLPYAGVDATKLEVFLIFVADDKDLVLEGEKDAFNEDNKTVFSGAYLGNKNLAIYGSAKDDRVTLDKVGETFKVSSVDVNRSYPISKVELVYVQTGDGADQILAASLTVSILAHGGAGNDRLVGGKAVSYIFGGDGNDTLEGGDNSDFLFGGNGNDTLESGAGKDFIVGDPGNDSLDGGAGGDLIHGGSGNDILKGGDGDDSLVGDDGNDSLYGVAGGDRYIFGVASSIELDVVHEDAELGVDSLDFSRVAASTPVRVNLDYRSAGTTVAKHTNRTVLVNSNGSLKNFENVVGSAGNDVIIGNDANNGLEGGDGNDELKGGDGNDDLSGGLGNDVISGEAGNDRLFGAAGTDILVGGAGADTIDGGNGEDILISGTATAFATEAGRLALIQEWSSSKTRLQRVTLIRSGVGAPKVTLKGKVDVKNDGSKDVLQKGGTGVDWAFFHHIDDTFRPQAGDLLDYL